MSMSPDETKNHLCRLREDLRSAGNQGLVIPSTDEYLSEFPQPFARRLKWATGFRGSTGVAAVLQDCAALFVDGRYHAQARLESGSAGIEILDLTPCTLIDWVAQRMKGRGPIALDTRLQSYPEVRRFLSAMAHHELSVASLEHNPIDRAWGADRPKPPMSRIIDYPEQFAGLSAREKIQRVCDWMRRERHDCYLLADPEDVAWLLNVRTDDSRVFGCDGWHVLPICLSRAIVEATGAVHWFVDSSWLERAVAERLGPHVTCVSPTEFESVLDRHFRGKSVCANLQRTPHRFAVAAEQAGSIADAPEITRWRWRKHSAEIACAREGHFRDGQAVIRFIVWLKGQVRGGIRVTEIEAARKLTQLREELQGFRGPSMPVMSSSGASGALPHYIPSEHSNRVINDHPIYWVDSGAQFFGCSTDNTICIAVGKPESSHILAHTQVLKALIALASVKFPAGISSSQLDTVARQHLWSEGMDYGHGTGHGVGNFMNIHEGPLITKNSAHPLVAPVDEGMIVSNEPAYYADGDFGVRLESHLAVVRSSVPGFLQFETISRLPIDPELVGTARLTPAEKSWLADYHDCVWDGYRDHLDEITASWLRGVVNHYRQVASV